MRTVFLKLTIFPLAVAVIAACVLSAEPKKNINQQFLDPGLDVGRWEARFSRETREAFTGRETILNAIQLKPGMNVADVGAGTPGFAPSMAPGVLGLPVL